MSDDALPQASDVELKRVKDGAVAANIKILENFYSFLISFALTQATMKLADGWITDGISTRTLGRAILYISLLITIVPFYQGMSRFLYETHIVRPIEKPHSRSTPMLFDIYAFLLMSCLLFPMGRFLDCPVIFFYIWSPLLALDIIWSFLVWKIQNSRKPIWAENNLFWLITAWLYWGALALLGPLLPKAVEPLTPYGFVVFEIMRTLRDYKINWKYYFPLEYR
jgi:hypothetical protein